MLLGLPKTQVDPIWGESTCAMAREKGSYEGELYVSCLLLNIHIY